MALISQVLSVMGIGMWYRRVEALKAEMAALNPPIILKGNSLARAWISCAIDSDSPAYVTISYGAAAFLFLGGIQLDYRWTLLAMISFYFVSSLGESVRILLAFSSARSLADVVVTSDFLASKLRGASTQLKPSNVYEDLGRSRTVVLMVFITQVILIAFVVSQLHVFFGKAGNQQRSSNNYFLVVSAWMYLTAQQLVAVMELPDAQLGEHSVLGVSMFLEFSWPVSFN